jgi:hypothetical protein
MQFTGNPPVSPIAPHHDGSVHDGRTVAARGRELMHNFDDVPAGLLDALLRAPDVEPERLDRAREWLRARQVERDQVPTCDELAERILEDTVGTATAGVSP